MTAITFSPEIRGIYVMSNQVKEHLIILCKEAIFDTLYVKSCALLTTEKFLFIDLRIPNKMA
jgi:hypothetical protein